MAIDAPGTPVAASVPPHPSKVARFTLKAKSCFSWTVEQMIEEFLRDLREGKVNPQGAVIVFTEADPAGGITVRTWRAQLGWCEEHTFLRIACDDAIRRK